MNRREKNIREADLKRDTGNYTVRTSPPDIMNRKEVSWWTSLSERTIRNYEARGLLPVIKIGRRRLYRKEAVLEALKRLES